MIDSSKILADVLEMNVIDNENLGKLKDLNNEYILKIVNEFVVLCKPDKITVITDSQKDIDYVRQRSIESGEEIKLDIEGHTVHYDAFSSMSDHDQARDKVNTKVLIPKGEYRPPAINTIERNEGLQEILEIMENSMKGKECVIRFFCLGPKNSKFSILALQLSDSFYLAHSEDLLYRAAYEEFKKLDGSDNFYYFIHTAGELSSVKPVPKDLGKRRIYVDLQENRVLTAHNTYAGNSLGLKKLALRLAINQANNTDWLAEHYFILGVHPKGKDRVSYFTGAYPSACGKTSTAMLPGQTIVGDDIAYLRKWDDGYAHAVNIEQGVFGIIKDVNPEDDPVIWDTITSPRETIFSNVLVKAGSPCWIGDGRAIPESGINFSGKWNQGKCDKNDKEIPHAHPNARYTVRIEELSNVDKNLHNPDGVPVQGIFYGGRDSDTMPPVLESLSWEHGVYLGASIESETTAATLGAQGVRKQQPMSNLDFIVVPLGKYLENHKMFGESLEYPPKVFATNYFLKNKEGKYLNGMLDKLCWVLWAEGRTHGEYDVIETSVGLLPKYDDLKDLFKANLNKNYTEDDYIEQFSIRIPHLLAKIDRIEGWFKQESNIPEFFWNLLNQQRSELKKLKDKFAKNVISPMDF